MAPKGHRPQPGAMLRHHSRTSSGGSAKLPLHLQFTQKDVPSHKHVDKTKKSVTTHEVHSRTTSPYPRTNHTITTAHTPSTDNLLPAQPKRTPLHNLKHSNGPKSKPDFTISSPATDEEEWISSESGAVTPNNPKEPQDPIEANAAVKALQRVELPHTTISRTETIRPTVANHSTLPPGPVPTFSLTDDPLPHSLLELHRQRITSDDSYTQTDTTVPPNHHRHHHHNHHHNHGSKRQTTARPSSTHSTASRSDTSLRPHPLIRGNSSGPSPNVPKPTPLAPLTVTSDLAPARISSSPPVNEYHYHLGNGLFSTSPPGMSTAPGSPVSPRPNLPSSLRRTSVSSARSVATLPVPNTNHHQHQHHQSGKLVHDRNRTLSTLSSSSGSSYVGAGGGGGATTATTSPALSSLTHLPTYSRPLTPQMIAYFPVLNPYVNLEAIHPLLPAPYLATHLTVLAHRTPIRESFDRVIQAKQAR